MNVQSPLKIFKDCVIKKKLVVQWNRPKVQSFSFSKGFVVCRSDQREKALSFPLSTFAVRKHSTRNIHNRAFDTNWMTFFQFLINWHSTRKVFSHIVFLKTSARRQCTKLCAKGVAKGAFESDIKLNISLSFSFNSKTQSLLHEYLEKYA